MSINYSGSLLYGTSDESNILANQSACSVAFGFQVPSSGLVIGAAQGLVKRWANVSFISSYTVNSATAITFSVAWYWPGGSYTNTAIDLAVGVPYRIVVTHAQGAQTLYVNGSPTVFGTNAGNTESGTVPFGFGGGGGGTTQNVTLDDIAVWNGYALTQTDVLSLLFGTATPSTLATPRTYEWTLAGTPGNPVVLNTGGLVCSPSGPDINQVAYSGAAAYAASMPAFTVQTSLADAYVATSGKSIGFTYSSLSPGNKTGGQSLVSSLVTAPTLYKNGTSVGPLIKPLITGYHGMILFKMPSGVTASSTDTFAVTAPQGWLLTSDGPASSLTGPHTLHNYIGKSAVGTDTLTKTFKPGMNISWYGGNSYDACWYAKNMRVRASNFSGATCTPDGYPTTLGSSPSGTYIMQSTGRTSLDSTGCPAVVGSYAVRWDASDGTDFSLTVSGSGTLTEDTTQHNTGTGGAGQARVFNLAYTGTPSDLSLHIALNIIQPNLHPVFRYLAVYGPGDFTPTPGTPISRFCASCRVHNRISLGNPHVDGLSLHYISRSGVSRSGMLSFRAARILACSGLGRATRRRASFLPSVVSRRMSPIWISPNCRRMTSGVIGRGLGEAFGRRRSGLRISVSSPACLDK
jgi:hypothetical protein